MDDIAATVESLPQIRSRVVKWVWFEPLSRDSWDGVFSVMVPKLSTPKHQSIRNWTWKKCQGSARELDKLLVETIGRAADSEIALEEVTLDFVQAVNEEMEEERRMVRTRGRFRSLSTRDPDGVDDSE
jgi:hypothetical protein